MSLSFALRVLLNSKNTSAIPAKTACNQRLLFLLVFVAVILPGHIAVAQGTWTQLTTTAPDNNAGVMLLLPDGTVMVKTNGMSTGGTGTGNVWDRLYPDINGSYINGVWGPVAPMSNTRLYFSSQLMQDGRVYVAGGEYGTGKATCEIYNPLTDTWTHGPATLHPSDSFFDANSEVLPDGKILQAIVTGGSVRNYIYDPISNTYTLGPNSRKGHDESTWVKLPDNSILYVDLGDTTSERYIPSLNRWVNDDTLHVMLYDLFGYEEGAGFLLPDGRVFCIGSTNKTAYYTPSGDTTQGTWTTGPEIPDSLGAPDAAATMLNNGKILCAFSHEPTDSNEFHSPTSFYIFDYLTNTFTPITSPLATDTLHGPSYVTNMLNLPDGSVLFSTQGSSKYYVFTPTDPPLAAGKPVVDEVTKIDCYTYMITGRNFNGISEGACYGDDWQMNTNFPLVRLTDEDGSVYYTRTSGWNRTGVMTGSMPDTAIFAIDPAMPEAKYTLQMVVNGNPSDSFSFSTCLATAAVPEIPGPVAANTISVYPNPAENDINIIFTAANEGKYDIRLTDILGRAVKHETGTEVTGENTHTMHIAGLPPGFYTVVLSNGTEILQAKIVIK